MGFGAAPVCSETFTMAEDPKASAVGEKYIYTGQSGNYFDIILDLQKYPINIYILNIILKFLFGNF